MHLHRVGHPGRTALRRAAAIVAALALSASAAQAMILPANFEAYNAVPGVNWNSPPTQVAFLPGGRMLVLDKGGRVWSVTNGIRSSQPMLDISSKVLDQQDRGLLSVLVDPDYVQNHYIYLLYSVDPDSNNVESDGDLYGQLARFTVSFADSNVIPFSSRVVLMGYDWPHAPLDASLSHSIGTLRWGRDGSLLVSVGDGAHFEYMDAGGNDAAAFGPGKTDPNQDIGAFRAQWIDCLNGKILRLNPRSGAGYPSNPFWNGDSMSYRSRVWAYGLRNPFRFNVRPGTGSTDPTAGSPGTVYIGDVGWSTYEELDVARTPGQNFGWPCYEGFNAQNSYQNANPSHNGCGSFGTSSNPSQRTSPIAWWHHSNGNQSSPSGIVGNCSVGGVFYNGTNFPANYSGLYFFADYGQDWIRTAQMDANDNLVSMDVFANSADGPVDLEIDPNTGELIVVSIATSRIWRVRYTGSGGSGPPVAVATAAPKTGVVPLAVNFSSTGTVDPSGDPLTLSWNFGDGFGATGPSPSHTFTSPGEFPVVLTADDGQGGIGRDTAVVIVLASAAFPTTAVRDSFDRANGPIGGSWVDPQYNLVGLTVTNNQLAQACCSYAAPVWSGQAFGPNQEAYVTIATTTASAHEQDLQLKLQSANYGSPHVEVRWDAVVGQVLVATFDPTAGWVNLGAPITTSFANGDRLGARAYRNGTVEIYKNATLIGTRDVGGWPYAPFGGYIGLTLDGAYSSRFDNFGGGDVVVNPNTPPVASILTPSEGSFYSEADPVFLSGSATDAQQSASTLTFHWEARLHHNNHVHFNAFSADGDTASFVADDHEDGTGVWYEVLLFVTDDGGMVDTTSVNIYPDVDLAPTTPFLSPDPPAAGANFVVSTWLRNLGTMRSRITHWTLTSDGTVLAEGDTLLEGLDSTYVSVLVPPGTITSGFHTMRVVQDSLGFDPETSEGNNAAIHGYTADAGGVTGVAPAPPVLALGAGRPNPTSSSIDFSLELPHAAQVGYAVFDLQGREVWRAPDRAYAAGVWDLRWDGRRKGGSLAPPGLYMTQVRVDGRTFTRRIAILR